MAIRLSRTQAATVAVKVATLTLKPATLEQYYRPDQPRAPRGTPIGGQWVPDVQTIVIAAIRGNRVADLASDLIELGGGVPILRLTPKGARQFIFPNGMVLRFDVEPGQYLRRQVPHINIQFPGRRTIHIDLR